jgi:hypothetical protein
MGLICVYQKRYAEAKKYLQRATQSPQTYLVHYLYAFVLSREGVSANGRISDYSAETATLMRDKPLEIDQTRACIRTCLLPAGARRLRRE